MPVSSSAILHHTCVLARDIVNLPEQLAKSQRLLIFGGTFEF
jgi:hypothetical protein